MKVRASIYGFPEAPRKIKKNHPRPKEIRVCIAETKYYLILETWQSCQWDGVTNILSIKGVTMCFIDGSYIVVHYDSIVDPIQTAATCVAIVAKHLNTPLSEMKLRCGKFYQKRGRERVGRISTYMQSAQIPSAPPLQYIVRQGGIPAYRLRMFRNR